ncbi:MAG: peptidoglycan DD-metalloendopeptidase family protein [Parvibaculaceae bacterium]|nr:peptidoglycan DD-metalloendopeptidase family protein [Parvibaculaceae bacterium]
MKRSGKKLAAAAETMRRRIGSLFVERQIYLRQHGQVHFLSLTPRLQMTAAAVLLVSAGWLFWSTFNLLLADRAVEIRNERIKYLQAVHEQQIAALRKRYETRKSAETDAAEQLTDQLKSLETQQDELTGLLKNRQLSGEALDAMRRSVQGKPASAAEGTNARHSQLLAPQALVPRETRMASLDPNSGLTLVPLSSNNIDAMPDMQASSALPASERIDRMKARQSALAAGIGDAALGEIDILKRGIARTRVVSADMLMRPAGYQSSRDKPQGGPLLPFTASNDFSTTFSYAEHNLSLLARLENAVAHMPLASPLPDYEITSPFGGRTDPFTGRQLFHAGLDLAARYGSVIHAPAPGIVSFAGWKPQYGQLIEIDHGGGFVTRYAHLSEIDVKAGQKVSWQTRIGHLGSTGRSTGPHLHYEIWYNGIVRDPAKFLEAGDYVLSQR